MDRYLSMLYEIVTKGRNTNSYKFALWRALASLAPTTDKRSPTISKRDLSTLFLEYYWPLEVKYHIRQGIDPEKDPIVMVHIRKLLKEEKISEGESLRDFQKKLPAEYTALLGRVAREAFDDVIPRFHIVHGAPISPNIYTFTGTKGKAGETIALTKGGRKFLVDCKKLVDYVAVSAWVRFTEAFTSAPKLHNKIDGSNLRRGAVSQWRNTLMTIQNGKCFYDETHDMTSPEVDHVLPWSFVLEDKTWNLVLACHQCNNEKRDRVTDIFALQRLCMRNGQIAKKHNRIDHAFLRHFAEWHSRDLSSHIKGLYDQAVADGFPKWK
jgi:hypothetical protein